MTKKEIKEALKKMESEGRDKKLILNIIYYLTVNHKITPSIKNINYYILLKSYDDLLINNEIITGKNIEDYESIINVIGKNKKEKIKNYKKILILNYYKYIFNQWILVDGCIYLDYINDNYVF